MQLFWKKLLGRGDGFAEAELRVRNASQKFRRRWIGRAFTTPAMLAAHLLVLLSLCLFCSQSGVAAENRNTTPTSESKVASMPVGAVDVSDHDSSSVISGTTIVTGASLLLGFASAFTVALALDRKRRTPSVSAASKTRSHFKDFWNEERSLKTFFRTLKAGPLAAQANPDARQPARATILADKFFEWAPACVTEMRNLFDAAGKSADASSRQKTFDEIARRMNSFKEDCSRPEFLPVWQLATSLEALLKHLSRQESNVTASCLRSTAGGLELLQRLCGEKFSPEIASNPPIKLLVVDDDPVSRLALSAALKRAFTAPDQAHDGESALALIDRNTYDVVFLDVEMPGLDGFEVCSRIHQTPLNRITPVVFVTQHRDFEYRVKAASCGGYELIEKPFVSFEIAVKALTLVLGTRFEKAKARPEAVRAEAKPALVDAPREAAKAVDSIASKVPVAAVAGADSAGTQDRFDKLCAGAQALVSQAQSLKLSSAQRLGLVLQDVLTEFVERPDTRTNVAFSTAESALALLGELCGSKADPNLVEPPVRILVVDDDPIARRAIGLSIQSVFGKPSSAESGEAAVALAEKESFDLVFLDVLMPGMNGFIACGKIHETVSNRETPVVFVTAKSDETAKNEALTAGGSGFIAKPISSKGILLTALTFALRARLKRSKTAPALAEALC